MARVRLQIQPEYEFSNTIQMRVSDLNIGGHIGNVEMVRIIDETRFLVLRTLGIEQKSLTEGEMSMVMSDIAVNFKSEGLLTESLTVETHIGDVRSRGFRNYFRVLQKGALVALAESGMVFFDLKKGKVAHVPEYFISRLQAYKDARAGSGQKGASF